MFLRLLRLILVVIVAVFGQPAFYASAQAIGHGSSRLIADQTKVIQDLTTRTDGLEKKLSEPDQDDAGLVDIRLQLEDISRAALELMVLEAYRERKLTTGQRI